MAAILKLADLVVKGRYSRLLDKCKTSYILYSVLGNASLRNRGKPSQSMLTIRFNITTHGYIGENGDEASRERMEDTIAEFNCL